MVERKEGKQKRKMKIGLDEKKEMESRNNSRKEEEKGRKKKRAGRLKEGN